MEKNVESVEEPARKCDTAPQKLAEVKLDSPLFYVIECRRIAKYGVRYFTSDLNLNTEHAKAVGYATVPFDEALAAGGLSMKVDDDT